MRLGFKFGVGFILANLFAGAVAAIVVTAVELAVTASDASNDTDPLGRGTNG
jgi:hypothetical protein